MELSEAIELLLLNSGDLEFVDAEVVKVLRRYKMASGTSGGNLKLSSIGNAILTAHKNCKETDEIPHAQNATFGTPVLDVQTCDVVRSIPSNIWIRISMLATGSPAFAVIRNIANLVKKHETDAPLIGRRI